MRLQVALDFLYMRRVFGSREEYSDVVNLGEIKVVLFTVVFGTCYVF